MKLVFFIAVRESTAMMTKIDYKYYMFKPVNS